MNRRQFLSCSIVTAAGLALQLPYIVPAVALPIPVMDWGKEALAGRYPPMGYLSLLGNGGFRNDFAIQGQWEVVDGTPTLKCQTMTLESIAQEELHLYGHQVFAKDGSMLVDRRWQGGPRVLLRGDWFDLKVKMFYERASTAREYRALSHL